MITVNAIKCPKCESIIYSRAHHDYHSCPCKLVSIDGGFDYVKLGFGGGMDMPKVFKVKVNATKQELYYDWNHSKNKFGTIRPKVGQIKHVWAIKGKCKKLPESYNRYVSNNELLYTKDINNAQFFLTRKDARKSCGRYEKVVKIKLF